MQSMSNSRIAMKTCSSVLKIHSVTDITYLRAPDQSSGFPRLGMPKKSASGI